MHYALAAVANETNDRKACLDHTKELLGLRLEIQQQTQTIDLRLGIAHNEHAIAWVMNGDYEQAARHFNDSIQVYQRLPDYWPGMDTNPRTNLGFTLWALNRLDEAYEMLYALLQDREQRFGPMDRESYRSDFPRAIARRRC